MMHWMKLNQTLKSSSKSSSQNCLQWQNFNWESHVLDKEWMKDF